MPAGNKPHIVFVGCPWRTIRPKYERIFAKQTFKRRCPLFFVIVGRDGNQRAEDLFAEIRRSIDSSSCAIFDVSGGNANVALEFGYAEGMKVKSYVFINEHRRFAEARGSGGTAIISDLSGFRRNPYKTEARLERLIRQFSDQHPYSQRVQGIARKYRLKPKEQAALMALLRCLASTDRIRRADLIHVVQEETKCNEETANKAVQIAKRGRLIEVSVGQHGYTTLRP